VSKKYGVIFDMDGVLVDSYRTHYESWRDTAAKRGLTMTEEQFASTFGRTSRDIIRHFWPDKFSSAEIAAWDDEKEAAYRELLALEKPEMDRASELIESLHAAGAAMAIGSSGPAENVQAALGVLRAGRLIDETVNGMDVTHGKPHPEVFLKAAEKLGVAAGHCAVVEDAPAGVEAALAAGMAAIAITGTAPREKLARAHLIIDSLRELTPRRIFELIEAH